MNRKLNHESHRSNTKTNSFRCLMNGHEWAECSGLGLADRIIGWESTVYFKMTTNLYQDSG